jgi:hypothetical protein
VRQALGEGVVVRLLIVHCGTGRIRAVH